jgi:hypothetical protein
MCIVIVFIVCSRCPVLFFNFVCCVLFECGVLFCVMCVILCVVSYCSTTATGYKPICSQ